MPIDKKGHVLKKSQASKSIGDGSPLCHSRFLNEEPLDLRLNCILQLGRGQQALGQRTPVQRSLMLHLPEEAPDEQAHLLSL